MPGPGGYRTRRSARPLFAAIGERIAIGESDSVAVDLPGWRFPFYGETYSRVYVNADGNLTFGSPSARAPGYYDFGLGPDGQPPRRESLAKLQRIRRRWITYFPEITRGQATVATAIQLK